MSSCFTRFPNVARSPGTDGQFNRVASGLPPSPNVSRVRVGPIGEFPDLDLQGGEHQAIDQHSESGSNPEGQVSAAR